MCECNFSARILVNGIRERDEKRGKRKKGGNPLLGADLGRWHTVKKWEKEKKKKWCKPLLGPDLGQWHTEKWEKEKKMENPLSARILVNGISSTFCPPKMPSCV